MTGFLLSPRARRDLSHIWDYTAEHWGPDQADRYIKKIISVCTDLAAGRKSGRSAEYLRTGYFKCQAGSHYLFYRREESTRIIVVRVLHRQMDADRHL
jgi:toxin ParE1/3/4